jgi:outer membrane protein OmpA-like peptidoglycan-associated protein
MHNKMLSYRSKKMKLAKLAYLLAVGTALSLAATGCRKGLDKTTNIPKGSEPTVGGENTAPPRGATDNLGNTPPLVTAPPTTVEPSTTTVAPPTGPGIAAASDEQFSNWIENRDEFKAQTVYFDFDQSNIKASEVSKLEEVARRMKSSFQGKALRIEGHCDERGTEEYNRSLGDKRALSTREKLASLGLDPKMMPTISYGEEKPADLGHTQAAFAKNRRAELILLSPPK